MQVDGSAFIMKKKWKRQLFHSSIDSYDSYLQIEYLKGFYNIEDKITKH